ncbi:DUF7344 domain-containing protein [Haladaptatus salinisoli]|uniref:DUF7344 domain-containing protein n=1 Tax=Haladaptatus salinisoli TaxID=2884876 RepID=UPI001D0B7D39|nr:hypothetical protein [Haladaptatus salinisoli]
MSIRDIIVIILGELEDTMVSLDRVFDLLGKRRRRYALYYLEQQEGPVTVDEVTEQVAEWETDQASVSIPEEKFDRIEVELLHTDLPKVSEAEYIRYDSEAGTVELTEAPPKFDAILSVAKIIERP